MSFAGGSLRGGRGCPAATVVWSIARRSAAAAAEGAAGLDRPVLARCVRAALLTADFAGGVREIHAAVPVTGSRTGNVVL